MEQYAWNIKVALLYAKHMNYFCFCTDSNESPLICKTCTECAKLKSKTQHTTGILKSLFAIYSKVYIINLNI